MPELVKLISLSELFGVSVDYLVKDWMEEPDNPCGGSGEISSKQADRLEKKVDELTNYVKGRVYRYDSKTRIFGLPLVSIRFGFVRNGKLSMDNTAKGIIAIGNCAIGVVAIGIVIADALLGEITPAMAAAVCQSGAKRVLIPVNHCDNYIVGVPEQPIGDLVTAAVQKVTDLCGGSSC